MKRRLLTTAGAVLTAGSLLLGACSDSKDTNSGAKKDGGTQNGADAGTKFDEAAASEVVDNYAAGVLAAYTASVNTAKDLDTALKAFTAAPSEQTLTAAKDAWVAGRAAYRPTEAFRFYDGPIDEPENGPEGRINAWPMDEAYVDYVEGANGIEWVGIINDVENYPEITKDVLVEANERDGEENISTGWHAIEFLLWGQDTNDDGPGDRPFTDYVTAEQPVTDFTPAQNADRRGQYLNLLGEILVADLESVADQWKTDADNYRADFVADTKSAVSHMFRGIGALTVGELSGERMAVAVETQDQEDEHSCFSDTTNDDIAGNIEGIKMVLDGSYPGGVSGPGLITLIRSADEETAAKLMTQLEANMAMVDNLSQPFDQLLANDTAALEEIIDGLTEQGRHIAAGAKKMGIDVDTGV